MADPFSIVAGVIGIADISIKLVGIIKRIKHGSNTIDQDLDGMLREIEALNTVNESIKRVFERELHHDDEESDEAKEASMRVWKEIAIVLHDCKKTLIDFDTLVSKILGNVDSRAPAPLAAVRRTLQKMMREEALSNIRAKLSTFHRALQLLLAAVNINETRKIQSTSEESFQNLSRMIQSQREDLCSEISHFRSTVDSIIQKQFSRTISTAEAVVPLASLNEHFGVPQAVSSLFTGRQTELETLRRDFTAPRPQELASQQKRFVIYGLGGSGKTQFCCKFAQDLRQSFWGVFWVDASSEEGRKQSFSRIAKLGKVEPKEASAKAWLSSSKRPWLLLIDNADDPNLDIEKLFPECEHGLIVITTRNPSLRIHGTLGQRSFHFNELKEADSHNLLLKAADEPCPWSASSYQAAAKICKTLGFLPLAVVQAGKSIMSRLCTLQNYLSFYETFFTQWKRYHTDHSSLDSNEAIVYSSYEVTFRALHDRQTQASEDAVELLKLFSFLHRQNIRVDMLVKAAENPLVEAKEHKKQEAAQKVIKSKPKTWGEVAKDIAMSFYFAMMRIGETPVLPKVLRNVDRDGRLDEFRLRAALKQLREMSFLEHNPAGDSYSMHPLIHLWVRRRPEMALAEQAVWCQAAGTMLSQAILFPHLGGGRNTDEDLQRDLLTHVVHVHKEGDHIQKRIEENQASRNRPWPVMGRRLSRRDYVQMAKFSLVYLHNGQYQDALTLQLQVAEYIRRFLGLEHPTTVALLLLIAGTYWLLGKGNKAADLQQELLDACVKKYGEKNTTTLMVMDKLGVSRWQQGQFTEAKRLHETSVRLLTQMHGAQHHETLQAMDNLGCAEGKLLNLDKAVRLHKAAAEGLENEEFRGPAHTKTLIAKENLALAYLDRFRYGKQDDNDLELAIEIQDEVVQVRRKQLGKEHPYTLLALGNWARIKAELGDFEEAETTIRAALILAERTLGMDHWGTLFGKAHLGQMLLMRNLPEEAETILRYVVDTNETQNSQNPDRLMAISHLINCYRMQGKVEDARPLQEKLLKEVHDIFGPGSPWEHIFFNM